MKSQIRQLPDLNRLYIQKKSYQAHRKKLEIIKRKQSQMTNISMKLIQHSNDNLSEAKSISSRKSLKKDHTQRNNDESQKLSTTSFQQNQRIAQDALRQQSSSKLMKINQLEHNNKYFWQHRKQITPYYKKKYAEQAKQNQRMKKKLKKSASLVESYQHLKEHSQHMNCIKQRLRKFKVIGLSQSINKNKSLQLSKLNLEPNTLNDDNAMSQIKNFKIALKCEDTLRNIDKHEKDKLNLQESRLNIKSVCINSNPGKKSDIEQQKEAKKKQSHLKKRVHTNPQYNQSSKKYFGGRQKSLQLKQKKMNFLPGIKTFNRLDRLDRQLNNLDKSKSKPQKFKTQQIQKNSQSSALKRKQYNKKWITSRSKSLINKSVHVEIQKGQNKKGASFKPLSATKTIQKGLSKLNHKNGSSQFQTKSTRIQNIQSRSSSVKLSVQKQRNVIARFIQADNLSQANKILKQREKTESKKTPCKQISLFNSKSNKKTEQLDINKEQTQKRNKNENQSLFATQVNIS